MKKLISILLLMIMIVIPFNVSAAKSPSLKDYYRFDPTVKFEFLDQKYTNLDLAYWEPFKLLKEFNEETDWTKYHIDDGFIIFLTDKRETEEVTFPLPYNETDIVFGIFITEEERWYVEYGIVSEIGTVIFDFGYLPPETLIMYVVSNRGV